MKWHYPAGATPLDLNEISGLIPVHITTQSDLNEWEQNNILEAETWIMSNTFITDEILDQAFIKKLHKKMFDKTWKWAGQFRKSEKNIGVDWSTIAINLKIILEDVKYQISNKSYAIDEIAARFHHRIVSAHPFSNGNGRHARLYTDILLLLLNQPRFSWGSISLTDPSKTRGQYIKALKAADINNYSLLFEFVRS